MMLKIKIITLFVMLCTTVSAQFKEQNLPHPDSPSMNLVYGSVVHSKIQWGKKPPNYNGEVLVFNHGFTDASNLFFYPPILKKNIFYKKAYEAGYQTVFVATSRGRGMWSNGRLLKKAIDKAARKYKVRKLSLIVHSNGGRAAEAAVVTYGGGDKVKTVISLGTPYRGTYLANLSYRWYLKWIWRILPFGEGAYWSQTHVSDNVRQYFRRHHRHHRNKRKFIAFGGKKYRGGGIPGLSPIMYVTGTILNRYQGTNDGITPYYSSWRPEGYIASRTNGTQQDHMEIAFGDYMWTDVRSALAWSHRTFDFGKSTNMPEKGDLNTINEGLSITYNDAEIDNRMVEMSSNYQVINSINSYDVIKSLDSETQIELFHENEKATFVVKDLVKNKTISIKKSQPLSKHNTMITIDAKNGETVILNSASNFIGFVTQNTNIFMKSSYDQTADYPKIKIKFTNERDVTEKIMDMSDIDVAATLTKTHDLNNFPVTEEEPQGVNFEYSKAENAFFFSSNKLEKGVYTMDITGRSKTFVRSLMSDFVIGDIAIPSNSTLYNQEELEEEDSRASWIKIKGNIVTDGINLEFSNADFSKNTTIYIYNLQGFEVLSKSIKSQKNIRITDGISSLPAGLYFIKVSLNGESKTFKFIKK